QEVACDGRRHGICPLYVLPKACWSGSLVDDADRSLLVAGADESGHVMRRRILKKITFASALVALALSGCGGGGGGNSDNPRFTQQIPITGVGAGTNYSFDLSLVSGSTYYFTDRNSAAVQAVDIPSLAQIATITGTGANAFAGAKPSNANSGP